MEGQGIRRFLIHPGGAAIGALLLGAMSSFSQTYIDFSSKPNVYRGRKTNVAADKIAGQATPNYLAAAVTVFSDDFNSSTLDLNKWRLGANPGNQSAVVSNALQLRSQDYESGWVVTRNAYPARNTTIAVKVIQPNNDGDLGISPTYNLSSIYGIYNEANFYRFYTYRNTSSGPYLLYVEWKKNGALNGFDVTGDLVINGAVYLRLRCDDTKIHFEASLDGVTWTDTYNETFALPGYTLDTPFYYELAGYKTWANGALVADDFSITSQSTDTQPPQISAVAAQNVTSSSAQIIWQTDEPADSQVEYGLTASYGNATPLNANIVTSHSVLLTGLTGNTTYHYRVKSKDAAGNLAISGDFVFQTSAPGNTITVLQDALHNGALGSRTGGQFVSGSGWQVTGMNDMIVYDLGRYVESGACEVQVRNFSPGTQNSHTRHHFLSMFRNPWGNHHPVENQETVWDLHAGFNYDPGVKMLSWTYEATEVETRVFDPWNLSQTYQIKVIWDGNQLQYFRDGVLFATHTHTAAMQLRYLYIGRDLTVSADLVTNFQNNQYPALVGPIYSNIVVTETVSATDQSPPSVGNIAASAIYVNGARLAWTTNEPAVCYVEYGPTNTYGQKTAVLGPPAQAFATTLANLASNQSYHYRIVALDNAGNLTTTTDQIFSTSASGIYVFKPVADTYVEQAGLYGTTRDYGNFGWMNLLGGAGRESYLRFDVSGVNGNVMQSILRLHGRQTGSGGGTLRVLNASWNENSVTWRTKPNVTGQQLGAISSVQAGQWHEINVGVAVTGNGTYEFALVGTGANVVSFDSRESTNSQPELIIATAAPDTTSPVISDVAASAITASSVTINWTTDEASDSQVEYGLTTSYGSSSPLNTALVTSHTVTLSSLQANTTYHYRAKSKDAAGNLAVSDDFTFATSSTPPTTSVPLYAPFETRLSTETVYDNPYRDISATGVFTSPSGKQLRLDGFWDGGQTWRVRFSPNELGMWSYSIQSADPDLVTSGTFEAIPPGATERGFVRTSASQRYQFEYSDDTPFLLMGDTNWDGMSSGVGFETRFKPYINLRAAQRFNAYHAIVVHNRYDYQSNEGGAPFVMFDPETRDYNRLNPDFFKWVDKRVAYADSMGMVSILFFTWAQELQKMSAEQYKNLALYIVSRYAAYNVFWVLVGDYQAYFYDPPLYREVGNAVASADPFDHPISIHPGDGFTNREFGNDAWLGYVMHQLRDAGEFLADSVRDARVYNKPVVNGEYGYHVPASVHPFHGIRQDANYTRTGGWSILAAGGYFVAGFHHTFYDPDGHYPYDPGFDLPPTYWDLNDPADLEAARQYSVSFSFFHDQTSWWELEPHRELVLDGQTELLAKPGAEYVAYNARGGRMRLQLPAGQYFSLAWFDPIAGELQPARAFESTGETVLLLLADTFDAAALLRPASAPALTILGEVNGLQREQLNIRQVRFTWQTPDPADSRVDLQKPDGTRVQFIDNRETTTHNLIVDGLSPNLNYAATVSSQTADGREWRNPSQNFTTAVQVMDEWIEAENMPTKTAGHAESPGWNLDASGYLAVTRAFPQTGPYRFVIRSRGEYRNNSWPALLLQLDNNELADLSINSAVYKEFAVVAQITAGTHEVKLVFSNAGDNRQLIVDWLHVQYNSVTDTQPPAISNVAAGNITSSSTNITWTTDESSDSQVEYGLTTSYGSASPLNTALVTSHAVTLSSLQANTTYHYRVKSKDTAGNLAVSGDFTFTTLAPSSTIFADDFNAGSLDASKWLLGANAGNQSGVANNALELRSQGYESGWVLTRQAFVARNTAVAVKVLQPNGDGDLGISPTYTLASIYGIYNEPAWYRFYTIPSEQSGVYRLYVGWKKNGVVNGQDVTGNLLVTGPIYLRLRLDDNNIHFEASLDGTIWTDTYNEPFSLPGYTLDNAFYYELAAYKTWDKGVLIVDDFSITNMASPSDIQPPQISAVAAQNISGSSAQIIWQTNEPADSQVEYGLTTDYGSSSSLGASLVAAHTMTLSSLQANTTYHYRVKSKDAAGNLATSGDFTFTTSSSVVPVISSFTPTSGSVGMQVTIAGSNFTGATSVAFNGTAAESFIVDSNSQIRATVPTGATTGKISVLTTAGGATSAEDFAVITTLTFGPTDDAYVQSSSPTKNYGTSSQLRVRKTSSTEQNTYLKFNISGLSESVQSAKLRLYVADSGNDGGEIYSVSNNYSGTSTPWLESGLRWNNAPAISGSPLASAGAVSDGQTIELDVTAAITGNGVYSFALRNNSSNTVAYRSKQGSNPPVLVIQTDAGTAAVAVGTAENEAAIEKSSHVLLAADAPKDFALSPNYPNPLRLSAFNAETRLVYQLPERAQVKLALYDVLGREVMILVDAEREPGVHAIAWNGRDASGALLPSGIYIFRMVTQRFSSSQRLLLIK